MILNPASKADRAIAAGILLLPILLFSWVMPFVSSLTLGNDYGIFPIQNQLELLFSLRHGTIPLYAPGFAGGQSAAALTLGQMYHPIALVSALLPGYWTGLALEWNTALRLLSLAGAHLALYVLVRRMAVRSLPALALTTATVYNLRMLDLFRYGPSLESWTGHLFLIAAAGWLWFSPNRRPPKLAVMAATYWLVCSGHPQMALYGLVGAVLFTALLPFFDPRGRHKTSECDDRAALGRYYLRFGGLVLTGVGLSAVYAVPLCLDFIAHSSRNTGSTYAWASMLSATGSDIVDSFALPLRSDIHSAFGGSSLLLAAMLVPVCWFQRPRPSPAVLSAWCIVAVALMFALGSHTPVHRVLGAFIPIASSMRAPGRATMVVPAISLLLLIWLLKRGAVTSDATHRHLLGRCVGVVLLGAVLTGTALAFALYSPRSVSSNSPMNIGALPLAQEVACAGFGVASLVACALALGKRHWLAAELVLALATVAQVDLALHDAVWTKVKEPTEGYATLATWKQAAIGYHWPPGDFMYPSATLAHLQRAALEPCLARVCRHVVSVKSIDESYNAMECGIAPSDAVVVNGDSSLGRSTHEAGKPASSVRLQRATYNSLQFTVDSAAGGVLVVGYPFSPCWHAQVNGRPVPVRPANGINMAVPIPAGHAVIGLRYWSPAAFAGAITSCCSVVLVFACMAGPGHTRGRNPLAAAGVMVGGLLLTFWCLSVRGGQDIGTEYAWHERAAVFPPNIAYRKHCLLSSEHMGDAYPDMHCAGRAVDGDYSPVKGAASDLQVDPWITLDLHDTVDIAGLRIYEWMLSPEINTRPLRVAVSTDDASWTAVASLTSAAGASPTQVLFKAPVTCRYARIQASGACYLVVNQVEVYPCTPENGPDASLQCAPLPPAARPHL